MDVKNRSLPNLGMQGKPTEIVLERAATGTLA